MPRERTPALTFHPLTEERWPDFVRLFGESGVGGGCWCMGWRLPKQQYLSQKGERNKEAMRALVSEGCVPGLLGYVGDETFGWCAVAPREAYPALQRSPSRKAVDERAVWSISCVYVARSHRRQGLSSALIKAAVAYARSLGARIVEGYPVPPKPNVSSTNYAFTGFVSAFEEAGFVECLRRSETRPIMKHESGAERTVASAGVTHKVPRHKNRGNAPTRRRR
jgi:GNAT superfamily N-acetyltransferase